MLNINKSYSYSLYIYNILDNKNNTFIKWKKFMNLLKIIIKDNDSLFFLYELNKKCFLKKFYIILNNHIFLSKNMKNFIKILFEKNLFCNLSSIYFNLLNIYLNKNKIINVNIYTKYNLSKKNIFIIKKIIRKKFFGYKICFFLKKDIKIFAGFKIYINDLIFELNILNTIKKINLFFNYN